MESSVKTREEVVAKRDIGRLNDCKNSSQNPKTQVESELFNARMAVKELNLRIEDSKASTRARRQELRLLKKSKVGEEEFSGHQYMEIMRELAVLKQKLSRQKLDVASALEAKAEAEKEINASHFRAKSCLILVDELRKEIEEVNEEQVLVELARIEAVRESREVEARREAEATQFMKAIAKCKARISDMVNEVGHAKELEMKLAATTSDLNVLQSEMEVVRRLRAVKKNSKNNHFTEKMVKRMEEDMEGCSVLQLAETELREAKEELAQVKEGGFQLMASMDDTREEMKKVTEETSQLRISKNKANFTIQSLSSRILRAKAKLKAASTAEEKAKGKTSNLSASLQQLQAELEVAKRDNVLIGKETESTKKEIKLTNSDTDLAGETLRAAVQELQKFKTSEAIALNRLRTLTERIMKARASSSLRSSTIRISYFEYEYLGKQGEEAQVIADKKVEAAQAWVKALKTEERDIFIKTGIAQRRTKEFRAAEEREMHELEKSLLVMKALDRMPSKSTRKSTEREAEASSWELALAPPRKSFKENGTPASSGRAKLRRQSLSFGSQHITPHSPFITLKRRRKIIPNLFKFLWRRRIQKQILCSLMSQS